MSTLSRNTQRNSFRKRTRDQIGSRMKRGDGSTHYLESLHCAVITLKKKKIGVIENPTPEGRPSPPKQPLSNLCSYHPSTLVKGL